MKAFTLNELLIVLVIIGILSLLALPKLMNLVSEARSTEAELQLRHLHMLQDRYFKKHAKYSNSLDDVGFEQQKLATEGGGAHYIVEIVEASNTSFRAKATAVTDFDGDGEMNVWEVDQDMQMEEIVKD